jgi:hypothetical protein
MHIVRRWNGLRAVVLALGLVAAAAPGAQASYLMNYTTVGTVEGTGVTGTPVITFTGVNSGSFVAPSALSLGAFVVAALPDNTSTTYVNTPFEVQMTANTVNGSSPTPNTSPIEITGVLNGTVTGSMSSNVVATFTPTGPYTFQTGNFSNTVNILNTPVTLVPSTTFGGQTTVQASLDVQTIPEPSTIALFVTALTGLGLRHRLARRKAA